LGGKVVSRRSEATYAQVQEAAEKLVATRKYANKKVEFVIGETTSARRMLALLPKQGFSVEDFEDYRAVKSSGRPRTGKVARIGDLIERYNRTASGKPSAFSDSQKKALRAARVEAALVAMRYRASGYELPEVEVSSIEDAELQMDEAAKKVLTTVRDYLAFRPKNAHRKTEQELDRDKDEAYAAFNPIAIGRFAAVSIAWSRLVK
jgi:hypothetical protein